MRFPEESNPKREKVERSQGLRGEDGESVFSGGRVPVWKNDTVLEMDGRDGCTTVRVCVVP